MNVNSIITTKHHIFSESIYPQAWYESTELPTDRIEPVILLHLREVTYLISGYSLLQQCDTYSEVAAYAIRVSSLEEAIQQAERHLGMYYYRDTIARIRYYLGLVTEEERAFMMYKEELQKSELLPYIEAQYEEVKSKSVRKIQTEQMHHLCTALQVQDIFEEQASEANRLKHLLNYTLLMCQYFKDVVYREPFPVTIQHIRYFWTLLPTLYRQAQAKGKTLTAETLAELLAPLTDRLRDNFSPTATLPRQVRTVTNWAEEDSAHLCMVAAQDN